MKNYYHILGVEKSATADEIKTAFRKLSKKFHPDVNSGDVFFADRFKDIQEAYDTLIDEEKREEYDKKLYSFFNRGFDREFLEGLKRRQEEKKKVEELKRREEEKLKEEEQRRAEEEAFLQEQQYQWERERRRKRKRTFLWLAILFPVLLVAGLYYLNMIPQFKTIAQQPAKDTTNSLLANDSGQVAKADTNTNKSKPGPLEKDRRLRNLNGRWLGTVYQFIAKEDRPIEFSCNFSRSRFQVAYPEDSCEGTWKLVKIDESDFHFRETITNGQGDCIQGGLIVLSPYKRRQYHYSYYWPNDKTLNASGYLTKR